MNRDETRKIFEQVKANQAALDSCDSPHDFVDMLALKVPGHRYKCRKCGGELSGHCVRWYLLGIRHATKKG